MYEVSIGVDRVRFGKVGSDELHDLRELSLGLERPIRDRTGIRDPPRSPGIPDRCCRPGVRHLTRQLNGWLPG